jgi:hypothetical protein
MIFWIGNIILLIIFSITVRNKFIIIKKRRISLLVIIMFFQLLFLYSFHDYENMPDTLSYIEGFDFSSKVDWLNVSQIQHFSTEIKFDLGWSYYTKILSSLFNYNRMLLVITGGITILGYFIYIKKYSLIPWLSIFLFISTVFYDSFFILRQSLAVAICLFSIPFIIKRKFWKFIILIFIAFTQHQTAIIFILLYFVYPLKINKKLFLKVLVGGSLFYLSFQYILNYAATNLIAFEIYKLAIFEVSNNTSVIISICAFLFVCFIYYPFKLIENHERLFFHMLIIFVLIDLGRIGLPGTIGRLNLYFYPSIIFLLPNACKRIKTPILKYLSITVIFVFYFIFSIRQINYGFDLIF